MTFSDYALTAFEHTERLVNTASKFIDENAGQVGNYAAVGVLSGFAAKILNGVNPIACGFLIAIAATIHDCIRDRIEYLNQQNSQVKWAGKAVIAGVSSFAITSAFLGFSITIPQSLLTGALALAAWKGYQHGLTLKA